MIDFRYHLVSLIAVFLAVALGIVIGTTQLNQPILNDIENQVTELEQDKRSLEDRTQELQTQVDTADSFQEAVAPALVGCLARVAVVGTARVRSAGVIAAGVVALRVPGVGGVRPRAAVPVVGRGAAVDGGQDARVHVRLG